MKIETPRLVLRDLAPEDTSQIVKYLDNLEVSKNLLVIPYPYTEEHAKSFVDHCLAESSKTPRTSYEFGIELKESQEMTGMISLTQIDHFRGIGTLGYWLGQPHWRKGIMNQALERMISFSFSEVGLRRIDITAAVPNIASNLLIQKMGFVYEGTRRERNRVKSTGEIYDENVYGMLKGEWKT